MNLKLPTLIVSSIIVIVLSMSAAAAQQKRQTPARTQPQAAPTPAPTPPPTFDTLIAAETYRVYGEVRSVGQLIKSNSVNEILEPILELASPPKELRTVVKWLNLHADDVMSSRMLIATWSSAQGFPETVMAIEFASPAEATKFQQKLNPFLQRMILPATSNEPAKPAKVEPPPYHIQQAGSLILISPKPFDVAKLRPAGSRLLSEDANFRVARNRLNTESIFVYLDVGSLEREEAEREKKAQEEYQKAASERAANPQAAEEEPRIELKLKPEHGLLPEEIEEEKVLQAEPSSQPPAQKPPSPLQLLTDLSMTMAFMGAEGKWPEAIGVGISFEGDSFDLRALLVNAPGQKSDALPFLPLLAVGPPVVPEASSIFPADTEMLVTMSLDVPQIYAMFAQPRPMLGPDAKVQDVAAIESPLAALERQLNIKIKDELLPLIGSEIVVSVPMTGVGLFDPPKTAPPATSSPSPSPSPETSPSASPSRDGNVVGVVKDESVKPPPIAIAISLRDKEGMRALLPKLIEGFAFKGASALAQTERREDTELVSFANMAAYAFIGNFLVISPDVATTRHVVDSYLKHQTLAGDPHFKNYTRWQPRQVQGQIYISPSLMESYRTWVQQPNAAIDDQTRAFLTRFSVVAQPVTYALSNEGFGPMHELHLPKNLVLLMVAAASGSINTPPPAEAPSNPPSNPATPPPVRPANPY
jgi:hypothetical protein